MATKRTITLDKLNLNITYSVKDESVRGCHTESGFNLKIGDKIVIDNYFHEIIEAPTEPEKTPTEATEATETTEDTTTNESPAENENTRGELAKLREKIEAALNRSAWERGVNAYALELLESLEEAAAGGWFDVENIHAPRVLEKALLNGADSWSEYSWGGSSLIYNEDIAQRLCTPSELKKTRNGERRPNAREEWLDTQARALYQAANRIKCAARYL